MCVDELQDLNTEAERKISNQSEITADFQYKYLTLIVHLERLNKELNQYLIHVLQYANEVSLIFFHPRQRKMWTPFFVNRNQCISDLSGCRH